MNTYRKDKNKKGLSRTIEYLYKKYLKKYIHVRRSERIYV